MVNAFNLMEGFNIMAYAVDIVIVAFFVIFTMSSAKKGFVNCFFGFVTTILAVILAFNLATVVSDLTGGLFGLRDSLQESFTATLSNLNGFDVPIEPDQDITELLKDGNMSAIMVNLIAQNWINAEIPAGHTLAMMAGETIAELSTAVVTAVILFILTKVILVIVKGILNLVMNLPLLKELNVVLGALVGFIEAWLLASLFVAILGLFPAMMPFLNSSIILTFLYNSNPIVWLISLFLF